MYLFSPESEIGTRSGLDLGETCPRAPGGSFSHGP